MKTRYLPLETLTLAKPSGRAPRLETYNDIERRTLGQSAEAGNFNACEKRVGSGMVGLVFTVHPDRHPAWFLPRNCLRQFF